MHWTLKACSPVRLNRRASLPLTPQEKQVLLNWWTRDVDYLRRKGLGVGLACLEDWLDCRGGNS